LEVVVDPLHKQKFLNIICLTLSLE